MEGGNLCNQLSKKKRRSEAPGYTFFFFEIQHTAVALALNEVRMMGFLQCCHKGTDR